MKITVGKLRTLIREATMDTDVDVLIEKAANVVAQDIVSRPLTAKDGIWRFDRLLDNVFGQRDRDFWVEVTSRALKLNAKRDTWSTEGYGIVASYAETKAAYATKGFSSARRNMT